ncbi:MAG: superoxide dismutase family protein [Burkholderiaceae bacterium]
MSTTAHRIAGLIIAAGFSGGALAQQTPEPVRVTFQDASGKQIGTAALTQLPNGVLIDVDVSGLPAGEHGFHFHQTGRCDAADGFKSAGEHFAPQKHQHGHMVKGGPHAGDMPNQFVAADGRLRAHIVNSRVTLGNGANSLFDKDGSALIIHAKPDDYRSQPSGEAGDRIACAVISRAGK